MRQKGIFKVRKAKSMIFKVRKAKRDIKVRKSLEFIIKSSENIQQKKKVSISVMLKQIVMP